MGLWSSRVGRWPWAPAPRGQLGALPRPRRTHGFCFVTLTLLREQVSLWSLFREAGCSSPRPPVRNPQMGGLDDRRCPRARRLECPTRPWGGGSPEASLPAVWTAPPPVSHMAVPLCTSMSPSPPVRTQSQWTRAHPGDPVFTYSHILGSWGGQNSSIGIWGTQPAIAGGIRPPSPVPLAGPQLLRLTCLSLIATWRLRATEPASCSGLRHLPTPHFLPSVSSDTTRSQLLSPARPGPTYSCPAPQSPRLLHSLQPAGSCDGFRSPPHPLDTLLIPSVPGNSQDPSCPPHRTTLLTPAALVPRVHRQGWGGPWVGLAGPVQVLGRPVGAKASGRAVGIFYLFLLFVIIYAYDTWSS